MITFAPTSAGKSHYVAQADGRSRVDFDDVVGAFIGWPAKPRWWSDRKIAEPFQKRTFKLLLVMDQLHPEFEFLFNMDPKYADASKLLGRIVRVVVPDMSVLRRNVKAKAEDQKRGMKLGQPIDMRSVTNSAESWLRWAEKHELTVQNSFHGFPPERFYLSSNHSALQES